MKTKQEIITRASKILKQVLQDYKDQGLISIYLWGSIITPDFKPETSDIDAVGILSDSANFEQLDKIREWLPIADPELVRLQINFFYLSELKGTGQVRSRLGRLHHQEQAVFDFPFWHYVCGEEFQASDFPSVIPQEILKHQIELVKARTRWALNPVNEMYPQYYCKSLAWLCYNIHKLSRPQGSFSWSDLQKESTKDTKSLVEALITLKNQAWDPKAIKEKLPFLLDQAEKLISKYRKV